MCVNNKITPRLVLVYIIGVPRHTCAYSLKYKERIYIINLKFYFKDWHFHFNITQGIKSDLDNDLSQSLETFQRVTRS